MGLKTVSLDFATWVVTFFAIVLYLVNIGNLLAIQNLGHFGAVLVFFLAYSIVMAAILVIFWIIHFIVLVIMAFDELE
jgi:hypothetical protein